MDKNKWIVYTRRILFLVVLGAILLYTSAVFERKTTTGAWNYSIKVGGFRNEPEESFDVIGIGSSHMYCTLNPLALYEQTGLRSYVLATQQQPPIASYYYAKEAFRSQSPDVLIVEALMFAHTGEQVAEGVAHDAIDPFPNSLDKLMMILRMNQEDGKENYLLNFLKYHSRWKELTRADFDFSYRNRTDPYRGYVFLTSAGESTFSPISYDAVAPAALKQEHLQLLLELKALAEENGAKMLLLFAPFSMTDTHLGTFRALHDFAAENQIETLDLNLAVEGLSLDVGTDFYDAGHLNVYGSEKVSAWLGQYLIGKQWTAPSEGTDTDLWQEDLQVYQAAKNAAG